MQRSTSTDSWRAFGVLIRKRVAGLMHCLALAVAGCLVAGQAHAIGTARFVDTEGKGGVSLVRAGHECVIVSSVAVAYAFALWAVNLYAWHLRPVYEAAVEHDLQHAVEHACFFLAAANLWFALQFDWPSAGEPVVRPAN